MVRATLESTTDAILVTDNQGAVTDFNAKFVQTWQLSPDVVATRDHQKWLDAIAPQLADPEEYRRTIGEITTTRPQESFHLLETADGRTLERHTKIQRIGERVVGRVWSLRDITARRSAEEVLKEQREWFRVTLASIGDAVITTDTEARVTFLNPIGELLTGWKAGDAIGQPLDKIFKIVNEHTRQPAANPVTRALREGVIVGLANHTALIAKDGAVVAIEDSAAPIRNESGRITGAVMVFHDVTERRKAEDALRRNEKILSDFFENAAVGLHWVGPDGKIIRANRAELTMLGYSEAEFVGHPIAEFHADEAAIARVLETLSSGEELNDYEARLRCKNGTVKDVLISSNVFWEEGKFVYVRCFTRDITEQKLAEAARARLAAVVESSDDAILSKSLDGTIRTWNRGAEQMFGYTAEEIVGASILRLIPSELASEEYDILRRLNLGERIEHYETVRQRKDGSRFDVSLTVSPIFDSKGKIIGASKIARDITKSKRAEAALREESAINGHLNSVAKALANELDLEKIVQIITDAATQATRAQFGAFFFNRIDDQGESYMLYTLSGMPRKLFESFPMPRATAMFGPTFRGEGVIRLDDVRQDARFGKSSPHYGMPAGHLPVVSYLAVPVFARSGEVLGGLFFGHPAPGVFKERDEKTVVALASQAAAAMDTARLYQAEQQARAAAEQANQTKDNFLAALSHELRTPLTPVLAILSSISEDAVLPPAVITDLETVRRNVELETRLIDDLLDLTRITRGKLELHREPIRVGNLIESAIATCLSDIKAKQLTLLREVAVPDQIISGDSARLTQVLWNLLKNAIKFTPPNGTVTVRAYATSTDGIGQVTIVVEDTGVGIEPGALLRIFDAFEQGDRKITKQFGGLGLGLAISKAITESHGGKIGAASDGPGRGSSFTLILPCEIGEESAAAVAPSNRSFSQSTVESDRDEFPSRALRILLVEDHGDTSAVLIRVLVRSGHEVIHVSTVKSAFETAEKEMRASGLDLVVSDLGLPDGSGLEVMRKLSADYGLRGIALSGYGMESDHTESEAAGFARHLTKPVDVAVLRRTIAELMWGI
jgi:PAS domain S-box-containing protein